MCECGAALVECIWCDRCCVYCGCPYECVTGRPMVPPPDPGVRPCCGDVHFGDGCDPSAEDLDCEAGCIFSAGHDGLCMDAADAADEQLRASDYDGWAGL